MSLDPLSPHPSSNSAWVPHPNSLANSSFQIISVTNLGNVGISTSILAIHFSEYYTLGEDLVLLLL